MTYFSLNEEQSSYGRNHGIRRPCSGVGLDGALLVGTSLSARPCRVSQCESDQAGLEVFKKP